MIEKMGNFENTGMGLPVSRKETADKGPDFNVQDKVGGQTLSASEQKEIQAMKGLVGKPLPRVATVEGGLGGQPVDVKLDRRQWTLNGAVNGQPLSLKIDHDNGKITGAANGQAVGLNFSSSSGETTTKGAVNGGNYATHLSWDKGSLKGSSDKGAIDVKFNFDGHGSSEVPEGKVLGTSQGKPVNLNYDFISGKLEGNLENRPLSVKLTNMDVYDFMNYYYAFAK